MIITVTPESQVVFPALNRLRGGGLEERGVGELMLQEIKEGNFVPKPRKEIEK